MDTVKKMKRQASDWKRLFVVCVHEKGHITKIYKELQQLKQTNKIKTQQNIENTNTFHTYKYTHTHTHKYTHTHKHTRMANK